MNKLSKTANWLLDSWIGNLLAAVALVALAWTSWHLFIRTEAPVPIDELVPRMMSQLGLAEQVALLSPAQFGVEPWKAGDFADYALNDSQRGLYEVGFQVLSELQPSHAVVESHAIDPEGLYWLRKRGFPGFRNRPEDTYQVVSRHDLRIKPELPVFKYQQGYIPIDFTLFDSLPQAQQASLEDLGTETVETPAGTFSARRIRAQAGVQTIDLWIDPKAGPLGLVKAETERESLLLKNYGRRQEGPDLPSMIQPLIDGRSTLAEGCLSCHSKESFHERILPPS